MEKIKKFTRKLKKLVCSLKLTEWLLIIGVLLLIVLIIWIAGPLKGFIILISAVVAFALYYYGGILMRKRRHKEPKTNKKIKVKESKPKASKKESKVTVKKKKNIWKKILLIILIIGIACVLLAGGFILYVVLNAEDIDPGKINFVSSSLMYDNKGEEVAVLATEKRKVITYEDLPQVVVDALVATEDSRFFEHNGFDAPRFIVATVKQLLGKKDAGGASTLTMQVVKNNLTSRKSSGIDGIIRKFTDIYLAVFKLEKNYTKEQIIEFYLNDNFLGSNAYGIEQASETYFGKNVKDLTLTEAALIIGLYQSPGSYDPYVNPEAAEKRRSTVLYLMRRHGYITKEEEKIANSIPVASLLVGKTSNNDYQGFIDTVIAEIEKKTGKNPYNVSMKIYTTLDRSMQDKINNIYYGDAYNWENEEVQAGLAIVDVNTGAISALGTGRTKGAQALNYAASIKRQPGSTAKPLFDYGPGMEYNNFSTYTMFVDEPYTYTSGQVLNNWDGQNKGIMTLREALMFSRNVPALKAFQSIKNSNINKFVTSLGIHPDYEGTDGYVHEAHAVGAFDGVSPLEMASAYAAFANGGYYTEPYTVTKIIYTDTGEEVDLKNTKNKVMADSTAYMMTYCLEQAVSGGGFHGGAKVSGMAVAAKTGTTNYDQNTVKRLGIPNGAVSNVWTIAYNPEYSVALWYGYNDMTKEKIEKGHYVTNNVEKEKIMKLVMNTVIPKTTKQFSVPSSVVKVNVEKETYPGMLPSSSTPSNMVTAEYFKKGTEPTEVSTRYSQLNNVTSLSTKVSASKVNISWNYVLPDYLSNKYLENYFKQSVFGKIGNNLYNARLDYNKNTLGDIGFGIYIKDGLDLNKVGFTTDSNYEFDLTSKYSGKSIKVVVKTEYQNFKDNASAGVESDAFIVGSITPPSSNDLIVSLEGASEVNLVLDATYEDKGLVVMYQGKEVTDYTLAIKVKKGVSLSNPSSIKDIKNYIDTTKTGTYTIEYKVTYKGETSTKTRKINILT